MYKFQYSCCLAKCIYIVLLFIEYIQKKFEAKSGRIEYLQKNPKMFRNFWKILDTKFGKNMAYTIPTESATVRLTGHYTA